MVIVLMGVSGAGKTTVGTRLADALGWDFADADTFHPEVNVEKMKRGEPLTDADRWPWLHSIRDFIEKRLAEGEPAVVTCSALKADYRDVLLDGLNDVCLTYLRGSQERIRDRLQKRTDHFFDAELLESQFETLEEPSPEETLIVDIDASPDAIVETIRQALPGCLRTSGHQSPEHQFPE